MVFSSSHVWMWELEGWALKNLCFWTMVLEKTLESPLHCKIKVFCLELQKQLVAVNFKWQFLLYYCNYLLIIWVAGHLHCSFSEHDNQSWKEAWTSPNWRCLELLFLGVVLLSLLSPRWSWSYPLAPQQQCRIAFHGEVPMSHFHPSCHLLSRLNVPFIQPIFNNSSHVWFLDWLAFPLQWKEHTWRFRVLTDGVQGREWRCVF